MSSRRNIWKWSLDQAWQIINFKKAIFEEAKPVKGLISKLGRGTEKRALDWEPENLSVSLALLLSGHMTFWPFLNYFLEKAMAPHSSTLAWKIPWTEEPGRLQSMGSLRVGYDFTFTFTFHFHALEKEMATHFSVLAWRIPGTGEPDGLLSMGSHRVGHNWNDLAAAAAVIFWWCL